MLHFWVVLILYVGYQPNTATALAAPDTYQTEAECNDASDAEGVKLQSTTPAGVKAAIITCVPISAEFSAEVLNRKAPAETPKPDAQKESEKAVMDALHAPAEIIPTDEVPE